MANIKQVANMAGVSTATVSKYLNGIKIKEKNMLAVEDAVKALDFRRNDIARGLRTKKSMTVGILLPELNNMFFTSIVSSIDEAVERHGYGTIVCTTHSNADRETEKLQFLKQKKIDGLITAPTSDASEFLKKAGNDIPVVLIDRSADSDEIKANNDFILSDNLKASREATDMFIAKGHTKIAILCGPTLSYTPRERYGGYESALEDAGIECDKRLVKFGKYDIESGITLTRELFANGDVTPTAIFATNNELTLGAVIALNELGIIPGKDISFIGFDNTELASAHNPKLTVIAQPIAEFGYTAADALLRRMNGGDAAGVKRLSTVLIDNGSVLSV